MNYTILPVVCNDQSLCINNAPPISSGGINDTMLTVEFSPHWDGFAKTAVFYRSEDSVYHVMMENDSCMVPCEMLAAPGAFNFGIMGVSGNTVRTTDVVRLSVKRGAVAAETAVSDPTPDIYSQIMSRIAALEESGGTSDGSVGTAFVTDYTLTLNDGVLSVNTADSAEENNTLPITSAAVYTEIGNINVLLGTI